MCGRVPYTNPAERDKDYVLAPNHVTHDFRSNGAFELPFGPNRLFFGNTSGWVARLIEGWQTSVIINLNTGRPVSVASTYLNGVTTSQTGLYANSTPDVVGPFSSKAFGKVEWNGDYGSYFGDAFTKVADPQCAIVAADLKPYCTLQAISDAKTGQLLLQNPKPGTRGSLGRQTMELPGQWSFDASMSKTVRMSEYKSVQIRLDATNIFNHPTPNSPLFTLNSTNPFGFIQDKGNQIRQFKGQLRFNF
jgi:hypothetical protein